MGNMSQFISCTIDDGALIVSTKPVTMRYATIRSGAVIVLCDSDEVLRFVLESRGAWRDRRGGKAGGFSETSTADANGKNSASSVATPCQAQLDGSFEFVGVQDADASAENVFANSPGLKRNEMADAHGKSQT